MDSSAGSAPPRRPDGEQAFAPPDVFSTDCPSRGVIEHVVARWSFLALAALAREPHRFGALRRQVGGISERMLSQTLQLLERDGLVRRDVLSAFPPRVEYSLTPSGARIAERVKGLIDVVEHELPVVMGARVEFDSRDERIPAGAGNPIQRPL